MKRTKRKYTRKATTTPKESKSSGIEQGGKVIIPIEVYVAEYKGEDILCNGQIVEGTHEFSYDDLPLSIRMGVDSHLAYRKRLGLPDDSKERKSQAIKYFRGDKAR